jgi:hypothetical protein
MIADGLDGIVAAVEELTAQGNMFQYTEIHAVLGEGNFVLTSVSEGQRLLERIRRTPSTTCSGWMTA